jgi:hypothetical protein
MSALLCFFLTLLALPFKSKSRFEAENAALRHQLIVLQVHFTNSDRLFFVQLYRWFPSVLKTMTICQPLAAQDSIPRMRALAAKAVSHRNRPSLFRQYKRISTQDYRDGRKDNSRCKLRDLFYFWCGLLFARRRRQRRWLLWWLRR